MNKKDQIIFAIRELTGDTGLYPLERLEALTDVKREVDRQLEWMRAETFRNAEMPR